GDEHVALPLRDRMRVEASNVGHRHVGDQGHSYLDAHLPLDEKPVLGEVILRGRDGAGLRVLDGRNRARSLVARSQLESFGNAPGIKERWGLTSLGEILAQAACSVIAERAFRTEQVNFIDRHLSTEARV